MSVKRVCQQQYISEHDESNQVCGTSPIQMRGNPLFAAALVVFTAKTFAQNDAERFKVNATEALVWDENSLESPQASLIVDPLTGYELHRLSDAGIEVTSRMGYERVSFHEAGKLLIYTTTVANNTDSEVTVRYGGALVDGSPVLPLWIVPDKRGLHKTAHKRFWELNKMFCFESGFMSPDNWFSAQAPSQTFAVRPNAAMTISSVTKDPRTPSVLCSVAGCHITSTIRYYITVNRKDYVFVWPGRSVVYCGE
jgi:hypothetical protein